jgi:hypothetical protein
MNPSTPVTDGRQERTVLESVDKAVALASADEEYASAKSALRWLLVLAWHDLQDERRQASNGRWSVACDGQVARIVGLTRLVGPLPWEEVSVDLILDGVYERIHEAAGIPTPLSEDDRQRAFAPGPLPLRIVDHDGVRLRVISRALHDELCPVRVATPQGTDPDVLGCAHCGFCYPHSPA